MILSVPFHSEVSNRFLQGMVDRMTMSRHKYGPVADAYPHKVDAIGSLLIRLIRYLGAKRFQEACEEALFKAPYVESAPHRRTNGNTEYLMDVANFAMIEFMLPRHPDAHFKAEDSSQSPGRAQNDGSLSQVSNTHEIELSRTGFRYNREGD